MKEEYCQHLENMDGKFTGKIKTLGFIKKFFKKLLKY